MLPYLLLAVIISSVTTYFATTLSLQNSLNENKSPVTSDIAIVGKDNQTKTESQGKIGSGEESKLSATGENVESGGSCLEACDDGNSCTYDYCNETTGFKCKHYTLRGEVDGCKGLVKGTCSKYSCVSGKCILTYSSICCGNGKCDSDENFSLCPRDCQQQTSVQQTTEAAQETTQTTQASTTTTSQSLVLTITVASSTIVRGNDQTISIRITDGSNSVSGASVSSTVTYASGTTKDFSGTTNSNGEYSYTWKIGGNSKTGTFSVTASASKSGYTSGSASTTFQVIAAT